MEQHQEQHRGGGGGRRVMSRDQDLRHGPRLESGSRLTPDSDLKDGTQPAEAEYLSSRCILFTYFQGNIGDVIDEHFSRALSQASAFSSESKPIRVSQQSASAAGTLWKGEWRREWNNNIQSLEPNEILMLMFLDCVLFRWEFNAAGPKCLSLEHLHVSTADQSLPPVCLRLCPPGLLLQPGSLQSP